eukprot:scaffold130700_cov68-Attheya_sp.AAC.1
MKWRELIKDTAWVVDDVLTAEECRLFISKGKQAGINKKCATGNIWHRHSTTVAVDDADAELSQRVYDCIKDHLPQEVVWVDENCDNVGLKHSRDDILGKWRPYALNSRWRVVCYPGQGNFGPHRDGCHVEDIHHQSLITLNGYLTDHPVGFGGATRFVQDDLEVLLKDGIFTTPGEDVLYRVEANKAGKAVVFFQDLLHDGEPLKEGSPPKWLFRTDVIYERDPETVPKLTSDQLDARELLKQAEEAEVKGCIPKATLLYRKGAYKLDPVLDS